MNGEIDLTLYSNPIELVEAASSQAMELISLKLLAKGICHIALTGGALGEQFATALVARINESVDLSGLNIWFSDERFVVASSPLRNSRPVVDGLQNPSVNVHDVQSGENGLTVQEAAAAYLAELSDVEMDICVLGLGPDGHVASLFPDQWDQTATGKAIAIIDSPKPPAERVSFSMSFINSSAQVWLLAAGEAKAVAVTQVLEGDDAIPAAHVAGIELTRLIVDTQAFFTE